MTNKTDPFASQKNINNKFKNSKGLFLTTSLFIEHNYDYDLALYSWSDEDFENEKGKFPSLKKLYLEMCDVTEYEFATTYLGGWKHWKALLNSPRCREHIEEWREELELKLRAAGLQKMIDQALDPEKPSYQAAKYLADRDWLDASEKRKETKKEQRQRKEIKSAHKGHLERVSKLINDS